MKQDELRQLLLDNREELEDEMRDCFLQSFDSDGELMFHIYIYDDGTIETLTDTSNGNSWLEPRIHGEEMFHFITVHAGPWSLSDYTDDVRDPEDFGTREEYDAWYDRTVAEAIEEACCDYDYPEEFDRAVDRCVERYADFENGQI